MALYRWRLQQSSDLYVTVVALGQFKVPTMEWKNGQQSVYLRDDMNIEIQMEMQL